ncbi:MAG: hypothetical protein P8J14_04835 [Emcibacteraceae bacterium]|nr:hypothetical protein [Emcibacteraceae bacterium]
MTSAEQIIHNAVIQRCKMAKVNDIVAKEAAIDAVKTYRTHSFTGRPSKVIDDAVAKAKNIGKKG